jgi:hypothetical protein
MIVKRSETVGEAIAVITEYFAHGRMAACGRRPGTKNVRDILNATDSLHARGRLEHCRPRTRSIGDRYIWPDNAFNVSCLIYMTERGLVLSSVSSGHRKHQSKAMG